jgi:hypothetical protein
VLGTIAFVLLSLAFGYLVSATTGEEGRFTDYAVAREDDHLALHLRPCYGEVIGAVAIGRGTSPNADTIIRVQKLAGGPPSKTVALDTQASGYSRDGPPFEPDSTYVVTGVDSPNGANLISTILTFRPSDLADGEAIANDTGRTNLSDWLSKPPRSCNP